MPASSRSARPTTTADRLDPRYLRPTEVDDLIGDASRAEERLGWEAKVHTPELVRIMVDADRAALG